MKYVFLLVVFLSCKASQPITNVIVAGRGANNAANTPYILNLRTIANETGVTQYNIMSSPNNKKYSTIGTFMPKHLPDSNNYAIQLPNIRTNQYFLVKVFTLGTPYTTSPILVKVSK